MGGNVNLSNFECVKRYPITFNLLLRAGSIVSAFVIDNAKENKQ